MMDDWVLLTFWFQIRPKQRFYSSAEGSCPPNVQHARKQKFAPGIMVWLVISLSGLSRLELGTQCLEFQSLHGSLFPHLSHVLLLALRQQVLEFGDLECLRGVLRLQLLELLLSHQQLVGRLKRVIRIDPFRELPYYACLPVGQQRPLKTLIIILVSISYGMR